MKRGQKEGKLITGLLYVTEEEPDLIELLNVTPTPLAQLPAEKLRPTRQALADIMAAL
ncbi:MAG: hypothetical protein R2856_04995 [Caldilineaceae bacterium]